MPAKKRNDKKYKPFIGRLFIIRKHKSIIVSRTELGNKFQISSAQIGEAALVLDENNTRVKITVSDGYPVWIPKFYLHKEITNEHFSVIDKLTEITSKLLNISENINDNLLSAEMKTISNDLSQIIDKIYLKNK